MPLDDKGREYDESWDPGAGTLDECDGVIVSSRFGYVEKYNDSDGNPQCLALIRIQPLTESGRPDGEPIEQSWSCGRGWEPTDNGAAAVHPSGTRKFRRSALYSKFLSRVNDLFPDVKFRGMADRAGALDGLVFHWVNEKFNYGGNIGEREHIMPEKFLREEKVAGGGTGGGSPASSGAASAPGAATSSSAGASAAGAGDWTEEATTIALTNDSHKEFIREIMANKPLVAQVRGAGKLRDVLDEKEGGFWAKARAAAGL